MRYLGLIAAVVLILCGLTYFTSQPVVDPLGQSQGGDRYTSAINAARGVSKNVGAEARKKWALSMQNQSYSNPDSFSAIEGANFSTDGEFSETLVISAADATGSQCTAFGHSQYGVEAAKQGFTELVCRSHSNGAEYEVPLSPAG